MLSRRKFGIEIEHGNPQGSSYVDGELRRFIPSWFSAAIHGDHRTSVSSDGSGVEVRTPPLKGSRGFTEARNVFKFLKEIGGYVTDADGMHVHFDAPEYIGNHSLIASLVTAWNNNQASIHRMVAERRRERGSCPENLTYKHAETLRKLAKDPREHVEMVYGVGGAQNYYGHRLVPKEQATVQNGRGALNIRSLLRHGTIEIRLLEGTLDPNVALAWVQFGQGLLDTVARRKRAIPQCRLDTLLGMTVPTGNARELLLTKAVEGGDFGEAERRRW
jgi:hypothetical protein